MTVKCINLPSGAFTVPLPPLRNSADEIAIAAASPVFWLEADPSYMEGSDPTAAVASFRWHSRAQTGVSFEPFGLNKPKLVQDGDGYALRFGFDGLSNGSGGHNGALKQIGSALLIPATHTVAWLSRLPIAGTEGTTNAGGNVMGSALSTTGAYWGTNNTNGRMDTRNQANGGASITAATDLKNAVWHFYVSTYDAAADDLYWRVDGVGVGSNLNYAVDLAASDDAKRVIIGGYGGATLTAPLIGDLAALLVFPSVLAGANLTALESRLAALKTSLSA